MIKGEIWVVDLPISYGHEQHGKRPVVVLAQLEADITLVIPCTTQTKALRFPHVVEISPTEENGLSGVTIALVFQLRAIDKKRLLKRIGILDDISRSVIDSMLKEMLKLG